MSKNVIVIGASGHGKVIADIVLSSGDKILGFLDDNKTGNFIGFPVLGTVTDHIFRKDVCYIIAIGNANIRETIALRIDKEYANLYTAVHPSAVISAIDTTIGSGTVVMADAVINSSAKIGRHCIINSGAIIEHDNTIHDYVHISVGAKLGGTVKIGRKTWVGIGSAVKNNTSICSECMIGAGAVVVEDILKSGTYVGVPARELKRDAL